MQELCRNEDWLPSGLGAGVFHTRSWNLISKTMHQWDTDVYVHTHYADSTKH